MKVPFGNLVKQYHNAVRNELQDSWKEILESGSFILGPQVETFERAFAGFCQTKYAVGVGSGTDALTLALRAVGIGYGDEVITAVNSFVATAEAIVHAGGVPVFVDIKPQTFNIDPMEIEAAITSRTKAIIPVHLYGQPADMNPILKIAKKRDLMVIEDAAQAHGAIYEGRRVGCFGHAACFSFYPGKNLGAYGDAGAVVTSDEKVAQRVSQLRDHGAEVKYQHEFLGYTSRLDSLQAAVLSIKLRHLHEWNQARRELARLYDELLSDIPGIITPRVMANVEHVFHLYVVRVERGNRTELQQYLRERGIQTLIHYPKPITATAAFAQFNAQRFPHAEKAAESILSLPLFPELEKQQIEYVTEAIRGYTDHQSKMPAPPGLSGSGLSPASTS
jgi:dTDP-4-amino-4,6-dideoxygalactose transaminase